MFVRVFTLLRHLLQQPFHQAEGVALPEHLIERTEAFPGAYLPSEAATLRKDLEKLLTPYGFRHRNDNVRHGYAIGTALLSAHRLREIHGVVSQAAGRLADPTAQDLLRELPGDTWWHHPKAPHVLQPGSPADSHPYRVELDLPSWTLAADIDLRAWLFAFGAGIRIESPEALRDEHRQKLVAALAVYQPA